MTRQYGAERSPFPSRRELLQALAVAGVVGLPSRGHAALDENMRSTLAAVAEAFVPGAAKAGVVDFVAAMLESPQSLQFYGYLNFPLPPREFYAVSLASLAAFVKTRTGKAAAALAVEDLQKILLDLLALDVPAWKGPSPVLVYLTLRNDAVDVVYSSEAAYDELGLPYMAHIAPPGPW